MPFCIMLQRGRPILSPVETGEMVLAAAASPSGAAFGVISCAPGSGTAGIWLLSTLRLVHHDFN